jgi:threonine synthase
MNSVRKHFGNLDALNEDDMTTSPNKQLHSEPLPDNCRFINNIAPTPLIPVQLTSDGATIWCKLEFLNPSGSTKDRIARYMLERQWRLGRLKKGDRVVEASSGSTSIALALACAQMGLKFVAVMPESVSKACSDYSSLRRRHHFNSKK